MACRFPTRMGPPDYLRDLRGAEDLHPEHARSVWRRARSSKRMYRAFAEPKQLIWIEAADHFFAGALEAIGRDTRCAASR